MRFLRYMSIFTILAIMCALQGYEIDAMDGHTWQGIDYLRWTLVYYYTIALFAPAVFRLTARYPIEPPHQLRHLPLHVCASVVFAACVILVDSVIAHFIEPGFPQVVQQLGYHSKGFSQNIIAYWVLVTLREAMHFFHEKNRRMLQASRLQAQLAQSRLQLLNMQLHPHFLFNTLHAISTLIREKPVLAENMLLQLSELLRAYLDNDRQEIALARELELLDLYLGIQRIRYRDRLTTRVDTVRPALDAAVPGLILQPLVENAIKHGIGAHAGSDCVEVAAHCDAGNLYLEVRNRNSTLDIDPANAFGRGIGLSNARLRLKELYGDAAAIQLDALDAGGVVCRVRVPYRPIGMRESAPLAAQAA